MDIMTSPKANREVMKLGIDVGSTTVKLALLNQRMNWFMPATNRNSRGIL